MRNSLRQSRIVQIAYLYLFHTTTDYSTKQLNEDVVKYGPHDLHLKFNMKENSTEGGAPSKLIFDRNSA